MRLFILPIGEVDEWIIANLVRELRKLSSEVEVLPTERVPEGALKQSRNQYCAPRFLEVTRKYSGDKVLAVTPVDLFAEPLNFVFGQAEIGGRAAVISLHRLVSPDRKLYLERAVKEAVHELGHTFGLEHCSDVKCVMHFSNTLADTDRKGHDYCPSCRSRLPV